MKGSYIIIIFLPNHSIDKIGSLGDLSFPPGFYFYVGSAMGNGSTSLENRIKRHISSSENKKTHWHVDYLLNDQNSFLERIYIIPSKQRLECVIAREILEVSDNYIKNFGSSDCPCRSHLLYFENFTQLSKLFQ